MNGFSGKLLSIDLSDSTYKIEFIAPNIMLKYLGGRGLGTYLLSQGEAAKLASLDEKASIILSVGPLTNTKVPTSARCNMTFKSPLTGLINSSNVGGIFALNIKATGFDAIIITGKADHLLYLYITSEEIKFLSADYLEAKTTLETHKCIIEKHSNNTSTACIGPAGENGVLFASVIVDGKRSFSRGGSGAVWGSKNLKAIVVEGDIPSKVSDLEKLDFLLYEANKQLTANPITSKGLPEFGTAVFVNVMNSAGVLPAFNFQQNFSESAKNISGEELTASFLKNKDNCYNCPISCERFIEFANEECIGPEYNSIYALGSACGIFELGPIIRANLLCTEMGLDTISTGVTIACAMEMHEKGILNEKISFGDANSQYELIKDIAAKKGLGAKLAMGSKLFSEEFSHPELAMQVKGLELPAYDPRASQGQGLAYATSNFGGCIESANMTLPEILGIPKMINRDAVHGKAGLLIVMQHTYAILDSLLLCKNISYALGEEFLARILTAVSGYKFEPMDLQKIGERIWNTERIFNLHAGLLPESDDTLPARLIGEGSIYGPAAGKLVNLKPMLEEYYRFRSWTSNGFPSKEKLSELDLEL